MHYLSTRRLTIVLLASGLTVAVQADKPAPPKVFTVSEIAERTRPSLVVIRANGERNPDAIAEGRG